MKRNVLSKYTCIYIQLVLEYCNFWSKKSIVMCYLNLYYDPIESYIEYFGTKKLITLFKFSLFEEPLY